MGVCLMKTHIRVTIAVLDIDYLVTDNIYARPVAQELLVGWFYIMLLCFNELMVKVKIILLTGFQLTSSKQGFEDDHFILSAVLKS